MIGSRILLAAGMVAMLQGPQDELLQRVRANVARLIDTLPRCMCTQTIDRIQYHPVILNSQTACDTGPFRQRTFAASADRLRLDVATTQEREMYSWVGEGRFSDRDLLDLVQDGAISSGNFGGFLGIVIHPKETNLSYRGEKTEKGRTLAEFGFRVPRERSGYIYGNGPNKFVTGFEGTILVDPRTGELAQMVVRTERLPWTSGACFATTTLDYGRVRLRDAEVLLAAQTRVIIRKVTGEESENRIVLSGCREFLGESSISFDAPTGKPASAAHPSEEPQPLVLPPGLSFRVALTQDIDASKAAAGDPLKARLITAIVDPTTRDAPNILVPSGALINARIVHLRQFYGSESVLMLGITLETVEVGGVPMRVTATQYLEGKFRKTERGLFDQRARDPYSGLQKRTAIIAFKKVRQPYMIHRGLESMWVTEN